MSLFHPHTMPASSHIPADVIDCIIDHLAVTDVESPLVQATLRACTATARAFYWPATKYLFRDLRLHMTASWNEKRKVISTADIASVSRADARLRRLSDIAHANPGVLASVRALRVEIDVHRLILRPASAFWDVVAHLSQHGGGITSVAVVGTTNAWGEPWRWLRNIEHDTQVAAFLALIQHATADTFHFENISLMTPTVDILGTLPRAQRVSFARLRGTRSEVSKDAVLSPAPEVKAKIPPVSVAAFRVESDADMDTADACLERLFGSLVTLEMNYTGPYWSTVRPPRVNLSQLRRLRKLQISVPVTHIPPKPYPSGNHGSGWPSFACPLINTTWESSIHTLEVLISYTFNNLKDDFLGFIASFQSQTEPFDRQSLFITSEELWSAFHPHKLREKHHALQKIHVVLDIQGWSTSATGQDNAYVEHRLAEEVFQSIMCQTRSEAVADCFVGMCEVDVLLSA